MSSKFLAADEIRAEIARRNMTRKDLAQATGISYSYLLRILQGRRHAPKLRAKIADYLSRTTKKEIAA